MTRATVIAELNEILERDYGIERTVEETITTRDLAILVQALKQGKRKPQRGHA